MSELKCKNCGKGLLKHSKLIMPSHSKSQQRLFGMVHAYQKGKLKNAPAKIKDVASNISMNNATHFAETKHKGLRNKVKKVANDMGLVLNHPNAPKLSKRRHNMLNDYGKYLSGELESDPTEKKAANYNSQNILNQYYNHMNKQAFDRGFFKAALENGVEPLLAAALLKHANFDLNTSLATMKNSVPSNIQELVNPAMIGAGVGALGGAMTAPEGKKLRNAGIGAGLGLVGGGIAGMGMHGAHEFGDAQKALNADNNQNIHSAIRGGALAGVDPASKSYGPEIDKLNETGKNIGSASYLQSLLGQQNPIAKNWQIQEQFQ